MVNLNQGSGERGTSARRKGDLGLKSNRAFVLTASAGVLVAAAVGFVVAADHLDPSPRVGMPVGNSADIADVYAWNTGTSTLTDNIVVALTFAGPIGPTFTGDRDVLYTIEIDNEDEMFDPNLSIRARFAQNSAGQWGVQFTGIPGTDGPVVGPVGAIIDLGGASAYAGVREDPFFFDLTGFQNTLMTGTLSFDPTRDFFAGGNVSAIVVEIPLRALPGDGPYQVWATTGRI